MSSARRQPVILLAEDSEDDAFFFRWTLQKAGLKCQVVHATDGALTSHGASHVPLHSTARFPGSHFAFTSQLAAA